MSVGLSLLTALLQQRDPRVFVDCPIDPNSFVGSEQDVYSFIQNHLQQYGVLPEENTVTVLTGTELPTIPQEPLQFWLDLFNQRTLGNRLTRALSELSDALTTGDYEKAAVVIQTASAMTSEAKGSQSRINALKDLIHIIMANHDNKQRMAISPNVPFGFPYLDAISDGLQRGDTIALAGKTGAGKSYILSHFALKAHEAGKRPLIISMEMSAEQIGRRVLSLRSGVPESRIARGNLSTNVTRPMVVDSMLQIEDGPSFYIIDGKFSLRMDEIINMCRALSPDVVYIDGAYLISMPYTYKSSSRWDRIADVAEQLKIMAGRLDIPVLGTYQANADKSIYGSKAIQHLASIVLFISDYKATDEGERESWEVVGKEKTLEIVKGRGGEQGKIKIVTDLYHGARIYQEAVIDNYLIGEDIDA